MKLYNLTLNNQSQLTNLDLSHHNITEVEEAPRLRPVDDPTDYEQLKSVVIEATKDIPLGSAVLIGGLGQYQALIMQLSFQFFFANFNPVKQKVEGLIEHQPFNRKELFDIENN